jgi:hypothetical protein
MPEIDDLTVTLLSRPRISGCLGALRIRLVCINRRTGRLSVSSGMRLCRGRFGRCTLLEHHRNAIQDRVVAGTTSALQPCVQSIVWTGGDGLMAYRAHKNIEQSLGKNSARHAESLAPSREQAHLP